MSFPVAIVTGGSSGIGIGLVQHLRALKWRVVVADLNPPTETLDENTLFIKTDISSWDQQAEMFRKAYDWGKRLDFVALNAGVIDRDDIFNTLSHDLNKPPRQPSITTFIVNIIGTYYGVKLAVHYMTVDSTKAGKCKQGGKIVITSSGTGLFPMPAIPQYSASKHALVGLTRSLGRGKAAIEANVRINAVCPAIVATPAIPQALLNHLPSDQITPMSTIMKCFDVCADLAHAEQPDWVEKGPTGETVEGNVNDLIWHQPPVSPQAENAKFERQKVVSAVAEAYKNQIHQYMLKDSS